MARRKNGVLQRWKRMFEDAARLFKRFIMQVRNFMKSGL